MMILCWFAENHWYYVKTESYGICQLRNLCMFEGSPEHLFFLRKNAAGKSRALMSTGMVQISCMFFIGMNTHQHRKKECLYPRIWAIPAYTLCRTLDSFPFAGLWKKMKKQNTLFKNSKVIIYWIYIWSRIKYHTLSKWYWFFLGVLYDYCSRLCPRVTHPSNYMCGFKEILVTNVLSVRWNQQASS